MKEQRLNCDRCGATAFWDEDRREWWSFTPENTDVKIHKDHLDRIDFCPSCRYDFEEWMLVGSDDLTHSAEMYLKGMRIHIGDNEDDEDE